MTAPATVAEAHYRQQAALAQDSARVAQRYWRQINPADIAASWSALAAILLRLLTVSQRSAAGSAESYVTAILRAAGVVPAPVGRVSPAAFAAVASDGRDLGSLLTTPLIDVFSDIEKGMTTDTALLCGMNRLVPIAATQVQDAGRMAAQAAMAADQHVTRYIRRVNLPACARCIILAGRIYRYSTGFQRHPNCDCYMVPDLEEIEPQDPADLIAQMRRDHPAALAKSMSGADLQALDAGADLNQLVNAHRGMATAAVTREGTTRRGLAGQRLRGTPRPSAAAIFDDADRLAWSREQLLAALMRAGYVI